MKLFSIELNYISLSYFYGLLFNYIYTYLTFFCFGIDCSVGPYFSLSSRHLLHTGSTELAHFIFFLHYSVKSSTSRVT